MSAVNETKTFNHAGGGWARSCRISGIPEPRRPTVRVQVCDFVDDAGGRGHAAAFAVQKWDTDGDKRFTVVDASAARNCQPYPLGWVTTKLNQIWLWPGPSVSMGEEATAARGFRKGDSARFVLYSRFSEKGKKTAWAYPTPSFEIDEETPPSVTALRVRH